MEVWARIVRILTRKKLPKRTHLIQGDGVIDLFRTWWDFEQIEVRFMIWIIESVGIALEVIEGQRHFTPGFIARVFLDDAILGRVALLVSFYEFPHCR